MIIMPEDKEIILQLSTEEQASVFLALLSSEDEIPELTPLARMAYTVIKGKSERISSIKSAAGSQGGAPKGNSNARKQPKQAEQPKQADEEKTSKTTETSHRTVTVPLPYPTVTDTVPSNDNNICVDDTPPSPKGGDAKRRPKSVDEVREYCNERDNNVDPEKWYDYYASNGWKIGKNAMRDWKAAVRTWERNDYDNHVTNAPVKTKLSVSEHNNRIFDKLLNEPEDKAAIILPEDLFRIL